MQTHYIKVHYDNGDTIETKINGTVSEIVRYYLDNKAVFERDGETEYLATARCIEFIGEPYRKPYPKAEYWRQLLRVYSITKKTMEKYDLHYKFRCTFYTDGQTYFVPIKDDCAYFFGMFDVA